MGKLHDLVRRQDFRGILEIVREFHGHICPYVVLGVKASLIAMKKLKINRLGFNESVDEDILAIVEANNCFTDGVQITTGCTLGNNSLIYFDLGKTALTLVKRGTFEGIRIYVDSDKLKRYYSTEAMELFDKVIKQRNGSPKDRKRLSKLWEDLGYKMLEIPEEEFKIEQVKVPPIEKAPIFENTRCFKCGELTMATRTVNIDGKDFCLKCAGKNYYAVIGRGIVEVKP